MSATKAGSEMMRTLLFVAAAVGSLLLAYNTRPRVVVENIDERVNKPLFPDFTDPAAASGLEVLRYDDDLGQLRTFQVARQEQGIWALPSHQNYPADAQERLVNAATMFIDLIVIDVVSDKEGDHETYGVKQPDPAGTRVGESGVGTLVRVFGEQNGSTGALAELIIGNADQAVAGQHYVREPGKSQIYRVKIDPTQLSTRFEDWIETDLLKLDVRTIAGLTLKDYSAAPAAEGNELKVDARLEVQLGVEDGAWKLQGLREGNDLIPTNLAPGEELNAERLYNLLISLDDLKIVDVERKPVGLGADLRAEEDFLNNRTNLASLLQRGFFPVSQDDGEVEILSSDGELLIDTLDGVRYVLRFGRIAGSSRSGDAAETRPELNRYLFVTAMVNETQFPAPTLEPLPEGADQVTLEGDEDAIARANADLDPDLVRNVERITRDNTRRQKERQQLIDAAKKKVDELTFRFADWYYVVPEEVFTKLRLRRRDIITFSAESLRAGDGMPAYRYLEESIFRSLLPEPTEPVPAEDALKVPAPSWMSRP